MSRASNRFGRALNMTFTGTGNFLAGAADFLIGPGFGNSFRTAGQLTGIAADAIGKASWVGASLVTSKVRDRKSRKLIESIDEALGSDSPRLVLELAREFSNREPQESVGHVWQAMALCELGRHEEAIREVERASSLGMKQSEAGLMIATIEVEAGNFSGAVQHFNGLMNDPDCRIDALIGRASSLEKLGRIDEALKDVEDAIASTSEQPEAYFVRAIIHRAKGDLARSIADFNRADELARHVPEILKGRAEVFDMLGLGAEAAADRKMLQAIELLAYLEDAGALVALSPNGSNLEFRGTSVGSETMSRIAALKSELKELLAAAHG